MTLLPGLMNKHDDLLLQGFLYLQILQSYQKREYKRVLYVHDVRVTKSKRFLICATFSIFDCMTNW